MDALNIEGTVRIYEGKDKTKLLGTFRNKFLNLGRENLINALTGGPITAITYQYLVIGDGTDAVMLEDIILGNERFRKPVSDIFTYSDRVVVDTFIERNEANFQWNEIGLITGGTWGQMNSGSLLNRALIDEAKNAGKSVTVSWEVKLI